MKLKLGKSDGGEKTNKICPKCGLRKIYLYPDSWFLCKACGFQTNILPDSLTSENFPDERIEKRD